MRKAVIQSVELTNRPNDVPPTDLLRDASLFLDFDGTLVEIAERPDAVLISERLNVLMEALIDRLDGRVAVISGRPAAQIAALVDVPVIVVGSHGLEFDGTLARLGCASRPAELAEALAAMNKLAADRPGLMVEDKPFGVALHFRQLAAAEAECLRLASELARKHRLHLQPGKMMVEVRAGGGDKGTAIRTLMREPELADRRPVFMGDDLTDEPGFLAVAQLGGAGILVGEQRESAAQFSLSGVEAALAWLEAASAETA
jgi:trehalose 6-phosphate phosphatase